MAWTRWQSNYVARVGVLAALAAVCSYIEALIPIPLGIPGIKLGLANVVMVLALYSYGFGTALLISAVRIAVVSLLFGNPALALYSLAGALFSLLMMALLKKSGLFSMVGVSMAGGVCHNIAQVLVAALLAQVPALLSYLAILIPVGMLTGILIGLIVGRVEKPLAALLKRS